MQLDRYLFFLKISKIATSDVVSMETRRNIKKEMYFQYTAFGPLDEFHSFIQICYYECPHISGIYLESLLTVYQSFSNNGNFQQLWLPLLRGESKILAVTTKHIVLFIYLVS